MPLKAFQDEPPALNLTPMIDVLFLLIIFFMVGARFTAEDRKLELDLPAVGSSMALTAAPQMRTVNVLRDGQVELNGQPVTLAQLTQTLAEGRAQYPQLSVAVRGDAQGPFQYVAAVIAACREAGVRDLAISVQVAGASPNRTMR